MLKVQTLVVVSLTAMWGHAWMGGTLMLMGASRK